MRAPIACCRATSNGRGSMVASSCPFFTICPSVKAIEVITPETWGRTVTVIDGNDGAERVEHHRQVGPGRRWRCRRCLRRRARRGPPPPPPGPPGPAGPGPPHRTRPSRRPWRRTARPAAPPADASGTRRARRGRPARRPRRRRRASAAGAARHGRRQGKDRRADRIACGAWQGEAGKANKTGPDAPRRTDRRSAGKRHAQKAVRPLVEGVGEVGEADVDAGFWRKLFFTRPVEAFTPH